MDYRALYKRNQLGNRKEEERDHVAVGRKLQREATFLLQRTKSIVAHTAEATPLPSLLQPQVKEPDKQLSRLERLQKWKKDREKLLQQKEKQKPPFKAGVYHPPAHPLHALHQSKVFVPKSAAKGKQSKHQCSAAAAPSQPETCVRITRSRAAAANNTARAAAANITARAAAANNTTRAAAANNTARAAAANSTVKYTVTRRVPASKQQAAAASSSKQSTQVNQQNPAPSRNSRRIAAATTAKSSKHNVTVKDTSIAPENYKFKAPVGCKPITPGTSKRKTVDATKLLWPSVPGVNVLSPSETTPSRRSQEGISARVLRRRTLVSKVAPVESTSKATGFPSKTSKKPSNIMKTPSSCKQNKTMKTPSSSKSSVLKSDKADSMKSSISRPESSVSNARGKSREFVKLTPKQEKLRIADAYQSQRSLRSSTNGRKSLANSVSGNEMSNSASCKTKKLDLQEDFNSHSSTVKANHEHPGSKSAKVGAGFPKYLQRHPSPGLNLRKSTPAKTTEVHSPSSTGPSMNSKKSGSGKAHRFRVTSFTGVTPAQENCSPFKQAASVGMNVSKKKSTGMRSSHTSPSSSIVTKKSPLSRTQEETVSFSKKGDKISPQSMTDNYGEEFNTAPKQAGRMSIHEPSPPVNTPQKLPEGMVPAQFSPYITTGRGKDRHNKRRDSMDLNMSLNSLQAKQVDCFRNILETECKRLLDLCCDWERCIDDAPSAVQDDIVCTIGQTRLLVKDKFEQFRGLINKFASGESEPKISSDDLTGFWEMILLTVNDLNQQFSRLQKLKVSHWVDENSDNTQIVVKKAKTQKTTVTKPCSKPAVQAHSKLKAFIKAKRTKIDSKQETESSNQDVNSFNGGFFVIKSPQKAGVTPVTSGKKSNSNENSISSPSSNLRRSSRWSLLQQALTNSVALSLTSSPTARSSSSPSVKSAVAQMRASMLGRRLSSQDPFSPPSSPTVPIESPAVKGILKSGLRTVSDSAQRSRVVFQSSSPLSPLLFNTDTSPANFVINSSGSSLLRNSTKGKRHSLIPRPVMQTPYASPLLKSPPDYSELRRPSLLPVRESVIPTKLFENGDLIEWTTPPPNQ